MSLWFILVFILKQKTAYEMRISDWSSDVCSSDLVLESDDRGRVDAAGHRLDQVFDVALLLRPIRRVIGARRIHGSESRRVDVRRRDDTVQLENPAHHRPDAVRPEDRVHADGIDRRRADRKSTRLNSSH